MKKLYVVLLLCITSLLIMPACQKNMHFLKDEAYRQMVHEQYSKRRTMITDREATLFSVMDDRELTVKQREAMEFLYAYMPLSDLADYEGEFFLKHVDAAFEAQQYFKWGKDIPDDIFRHFVLVYRVNNENLDTARLVFFNELKDRVKDLSMEEAILEVNHWCHEKVTYRGTDGRTSAPLALANTSWGRCGEESTFTAAALRAVGIPARQCYTPRWVHTDDNHAWVEVWANGKWHYIGACEPEPELDMAWFTGPVKRAMMVHTRVFGPYDGPEEKIIETPLFSIINLIGNYAQTRTVKVKVVNEKGESVAGAMVKFKVYNYAELYPIAEKRSDKDGLVSITSGMGDIMIWASKDGVYGYEKSEPRSDMVTVVLKRKSGGEYKDEYIMNPPAEQPLPDIAQEKIEENRVRLIYEDSLRNAYMNTFPKEEYAHSLAEELRLDKTRVWKYIGLAQGNWREIEKFIRAGKDNKYLFPFLESLTEKDFRDTPSSYLEDHLTIDSIEIRAETPQELIAPYVYSPRIGIEIIKPWRSFINSCFDEADRIAMRNNPNQIIEHVLRDISITETENYYGVRLSPTGSYRLRMTDARSRDIYFVAVCRCVGVPARIEQATGIPQYFAHGKWIDVVFTESMEGNAPESEVTLVGDPFNIVKPGYETHYTLAVYRDGDFNTLDLYGNPAVKTLPSRLMLDVGYYRLMIGSRANDGSVTVGTRYFEVIQGKSQTITISMPKIEDKIQLLGGIDMNTIVVPENGEKKSLKDLAAGKGLIICFADPDKEPTKHVLQDIPAQKESLDEWGGTILFMVPDDKVSAGFDRAAFMNMPAKTAWGVDIGRSLLSTAVGSLGIEFKDNFPLTIYLSKNGGILFYSQGYRIGIGQDWIRTIVREERSLKK